MPARRAALKARRGASLSGLWAYPLDAPMSEPFEIATGSKAEVRNILVRVRLSDGSEGWGEGAPPAAGRGVQVRALKAVLAQRSHLIGKDAGALRPLLEAAEDGLASGPAPALAALQTALCDAWARRRGLPLRVLFGAAGTRVASDVTVTIVPPDRARAAARKIVALGVNTIKIKVGKELGEDEARVRAIAAAAPRARLLLDANCGYGPRESLALLKRLARAGIRPALFEQPAAADDLDGLARVERLGKVPVAADESAASPKDLLRLIRRRACSVVNLKLMKSGLLAAWEMALIAKAAGLRLMIGGMVETSLAMTASAHLAAGLGGFDFIDLDTPLWLAKDPMRGVTLGRGGVYDLARVRAGLGVEPGPALRRSLPLA